MALARDTDLRSHKPAPKKKAPKRSTALAQREGGIGTPSHRHSAGHEAAQIARDHGSHAAHRYLARQNLAEPLRSKSTAQKEGGVAAPRPRAPRTPGMLKPGNINLAHRRVVHNSDGSISTVRSISIGVGKHTVLIPTVVGHRVLSNDHAIRYYQRTGQHLGVFNSIAAADRYAQTLHEDQARLYSGVSRSRDLAQKEGGIVHLKQEPREAGLGRTSREQRRQRAAAQRLVSDYERGPSAGNLGHALQRAGDLYADNPVSRNPIVGRKGLLGGLEDLLRSTDPISMGQMLARERHPIRAYQQDTRAGRAAAAKFRRGELSGSEAIAAAGPPAAGMVVGPGGGFGKGGERLVIPSEKSIAAKPGETRIETRPATVAEAEKRLRFLDRKLEGLYRRVGKAMGHPLAEADIAQEIGRSRQLSGGRARGKSVEGRAYGAPVRRASVAQELRSAAIDHLEKIAERNPEHPTIKDWQHAEAERAQLQQALHGHEPGEERRGMPDVAEVKLTPEAQMKGVISASRMGNREVEALRKEERAVRMARGEAALAKAGGGIEGHRAFLREQKGTMPDLPLDRLSDASKADVDRLFRIVDDHAGLKRWEKVAAQRGIARLVDEGRRPRPHEVRHLNTVFGEQFTTDLVKTTLAQRALGVIGIPRSVMASFDVSAPLRQNLMGMMIEPGIGTRNLPAMYRSFRPGRHGEAHYAAELENIHAHPDYQFAVDSGLSLTELAGKPGKREEAFPSQYAEQLNVPIGGGRSVGPGHIVRASGRAYTGYLDNVRFQMFAKYVAQLRKKGIDPESYPELRGLDKVARFGREYPNTYAEGIAKLVNSATGRGSLKNVESWGPAMNALFFSPRLMYSRINFLDPTWYFRLDPFARRKALKGIARLATTATGAFALAAWLGADVSTDPRNADFAKIRLGNTRVDILAGHQQYIRLVAQLWTGQIVSSTTGHVTNLNEGGYGARDKLSIIARFAQGKASPPASFVMDFFRGTDFADQPFNIKYALLTRITPLVAQDTLDLYRSSGSAPLTALAAAVSVHGVGMQTYSDAAKKGREKKLKDAAVEHETHLRSLVKTGALPRKQLGEYREALTIYDRRNSANAQIEKDTEDHPLARERQKMDALLALLGQHHLLKPTELKAYRRYYKTKHLEPGDIQRDRSWFWEHRGPGALVSWYHKQTGAND